MTTSADLRQAALALRAGGQQLDDAGERYRSAGTLLDTVIDRLRTAWISPDSEVLQAQGIQLSAAFSTASAALVECGGVVTALASNADQRAEALAVQEAIIAAASADDDPAAALAATSRAASAIQEILSGWRRSVAEACTTLGRRSPDIRQLEQHSLVLPAGPAATQGGAGVWFEIFAALAGGILLEAPPGGAWIRQAIGSGLRSNRTFGWARNGSVPASFPTFLNGGIGRRLLQTPLGRVLGSPAGKLTFRVLPIAGGLYNGVDGGTGMLSYGINPVAAYRQGGADYTANVGQTAFGFGTAGLGVYAIAGAAAPPVLIGVAVVGGTVWITSEVVDNWDAISDWGAEGLDTLSGYAVSGYNDLANLADEGYRGGEILLGALWDRGGDLVGGAVDRGGDLVGGAMDRGGDLVGGAVDRGGDLVGGMWEGGGNLVSGIGGWF